VVGGGNLLTLLSDFLALHLEDALPLKRRWISTRIHGIMCRGMAVFLVLYIRSTVKLLICFFIASTQCRLRSSLHCSEW